MVRIVKKHRKRLPHLEAIVTIFFVVSLLCYFGSVTLLRSHNVILATQESKQESRIEVLKNDVANLELSVKQLDNRERILEIAEKKGLKVNQEKIVSVASSE